MKGKAIEAALAVAGRLGLRLEAPVVLHQSNNVVAWLNPAPVVVKVGVGHHARMDDELKAGMHLARVGAPVVGPAPDVPSRVHTHGGFAMTFWRYQATRGPEATNHAIAHTLHELHGALERYRGNRTQSLPPCTAELAAAGRALVNASAPGLAAADRRFLVDFLTRQPDALGDRVGPPMAIHGSPHRSNILSVKGRPLFIDFETLSLGPVEWDLAHLEPEVADAYPAPVDAQTLAVCRTMVSAKTAAWCWAGIERSPELRSHAEHHLAVVKHARV